MRFIWPLVTCLNGIESCILGLLIPLYLVLVTPVSAKTSVQIEEIKNWKPLGERYVLGVDADGKGLAIYDLSFQDFFTRASSGRVVLGSIGFGKLNFLALKDLLDQWLLELRKSDVGKTSIYSPSEEKVEKIIKKISKASKIPDPSLRDQWMHHVAWKDKRRDLAEIASFSLHEIDLLASVEKDKRSELRAILEKIDAQLALNDWAMDHRAFFSRLRFNVQADHRLNLYIADAEHGTQKTVKAPMAPGKVADLRLYRNTLKAEMRRQIIRRTLVQLTTLITDPITRGLFRFAIERCYRLYRQHLSFQRFRALYHINHALLNKQASSWSVMEAELLMKAATYVTSHEARLTKLINPQSAGYTAWLKRSRKHVKESYDWLRKKDKTRLAGLWHPWHMGYRSSLNSNQHNIYHLASSEVVFSDKPLVAIDLTQPQRIKKHRNFLLALESLLGGLDPEIAGVADIVRGLYKLFVILDVRLAQKWDAHFAAYLLDLGRANQQANQWLKVLYEQRGDPIAMSLKEEWQFIEKAKQYLKAHRGFQ